MIFMLSLFFLFIAVCVILYCIKVVFEYSNSIMVDVVCCICITLAIVMAHFYLRAIFG